MRGGGERAAGGEGGRRRRGSAFSISLDRFTHQFTFIWGLPKPRYRQPNTYPDASKLTADQLGDSQAADSTPLGSQFRFLVPDDAMARFNMLCQQQQIQLRQQQQQHQQQQQQQQQQKLAYTLSTHHQQQLQQQAYAVTAATAINAQDTYRKQQQDGTFRNFAQLLSMQTQAFDNNPSIARRPVPRSRAGTPSLPGMDGTCNPGGETKIFDGVCSMETAAATAADGFLGLEFSPEASGTRGGAILPDADADSASNASTTSTASTASTASTSIQPTNQPTASPRASLSRSARTGVAAPRRYLSAPASPMPGCKFSGKSKAGKKSPRTSSRASLQRPSSPRADRHVSPSPPGTPSPPSPGQPGPAAPDPAAMLPLQEGGSLPQDHRPARGRGRQRQLEEMTVVQIEEEKEARNLKNRQAARNCRARKKQHTQIVSWASSGCMGCEGRHTLWSARSCQRIHD